MLYGILVATEFPDRSAHARQRAIMLATVLKCRTLEIFSIISSAQMNRLAFALKRPAADAEQSPTCEPMGRLSFPPAYPCSHGVIRCAETFGVGALATETAARANETAARLVVISWQEFGWLPALRNAVVAGEIVRLSKRPVLVVRNAPLRHYLRVLIPLDSSSASMRTAQAAMQLLPDAHFTFLHAIRPHGEGRMRMAGVAEDVIEQCRENAGRAARAAFSHLIEKLGAQTAQVSHVLTSRPDRISIRTYANAAMPDLLVLSCHQRCVLGDLFRKSSVHEVLANTRCDVLLIGPSCILMAGDPDECTSRVPGPRRGLTRSALFQQ